MTLRQLLLVSTLLLLTLPAYTQDVALVWDYGKPKKLDLSLTLVKGTKLTLALNNQLQPADIKDFFSKTTVSTTNSDNQQELPTSSLEDRIQAKGETIQQYAQTNTVNEFDLVPLLGNLDVGYTITIHPYLGLDAKKKPIVDEKTSIRVSIVPSQAADPTQVAEMDKAVKKLTPQVAEHTEAIKKLEEKVSGQDQKLAKATAKVEEDLSANQLFVQDQLQMASRTPREQKRIKRGLMDASDIASDLSDFTKCAGCDDRIGDLIYDFRCKSLFKTIPGEPNVRYKLVRDLSTIQVKAQNLVRLKVVGINRYLYSVNATVADSIYGSAPPALFNQFFSGSSDLMTSLADQGKSPLLQGKSLDSNQKEALNTDFEAFKTAVQAFKKKYDVLIDLQTQAYLFCLDEQISCCGNDHIGPFSEYSKSLSDVLIRLATVEAKYLTDMPSSSKILSDISEAQAKLDACAKNEKKRTADIDAAKKEKADAQAEKEKATTEAAKKAADDKIKAADDKIKKLNEDGCDEKTISDLRDKLTKLKENLPLRITLDQLKTSLPSLDALRKLYMFDRNIVKDHFTYRLPPIYPQGDRLKVVLDVQAIDSTITRQMGFMPTYHDELNLDISVRHKSLFSFSTGPFLAFGFDLPAPTYGFKRIPTSGTVIGPQARYQLVASGMGPLPIGLAGFAHLGSKLSRTVGMAATIGVGYTFNQETILPAFLGGISACFGDRQRINLTFGLAGVQIRELKASLYQGNIYESAPDLEYTKPLRLGLFASVTYSLFTSTSTINLFSKSK